MAKNAADVARKWRQRLEGAAQDMVAGVNAVTVAPTAQAAAKVQTMKARFNAAIDSGKVEAGLRAVSLEDWRAAMLSKGVTRVAQGAQGAETKVADFMGELIPYTDQVRKEIAQMPNATDADRKARMNANFDKMKAFKRRRR